MTNRKWWDRQQYVIKVKSIEIYALSATAKTKPYKERFSSPISRLVKTAWKEFNFYLREPTGTVSPMILFISVGVLKLTTCVPKIANFFPSCLGYWQVFGACQYFPSSWRWAEQTIIFCICPQRSPTNQPLLIFQTQCGYSSWQMLRIFSIRIFNYPRRNVSLFRRVEYNICIVHCLKLAQLKEKQTKRQKNEKNGYVFNGVTLSVH